MSVMVAQADIFKRALEDWSSAPSDDERRLAEDELARTFRSAWESGSPALRRAILHFIGRARPGDAADIIWESILSDDELTVGDGLAAALGYMRSEPLRRDASGIAALRSLVENQDSAYRELALDVMNRVSVDDHVSWVKRLATEDQSEDIRRSANVILVRRGDQSAKDALFADIRKHPGNFGVADDLWQARGKIALSPEEEVELRAIIAEYVESLRGRLRDPQEHEGTRWMAVGMLRGYLQDGFPFDDEDIDAAATLASTAHETDVRLAALETLAACDAPRARQRLGEIASKRRPKQVVELARRLLQPE